MLILTYTNQTLISTGGFFLRIMTGLILFVAGAGKVLGWFGGFGMEMTLSMFQSNLNLSAFWAYVSSYAELIGGFLLLIGLFTRFAALVLFINMLVAVVLITLARTTSKRMPSDAAKHKRMAIFNFVALVVIVAVVLLSGRPLL